MGDYCKVRCLYREELVHQSGETEYLAQIFTTDYSSAILHGSSKKHRVLVSFGMKTAEMRFSKTCVNFERCYGNQGWAEAVEK